MPTKKSRVQSKTRADFKLAYAENYIGSYDRRFLRGGGGGCRLIAIEKRMTIYLMQRIIQPTNSTI